MSTYCCANDGGHALQHSLDSYIYFSGVEFISHLKQPASTAAVDSTDVAGRKRPDILMVSMAVPEYLIVLPKAGVAHSSPFMKPSPFVHTRWFSAAATAEFRAS